MNRRGFLKKFGIGAVAVAAAPVVVPQILSKIAPTAVKSKISADTMSFVYGGREYVYVKGVEDAMMAHRMAIEEMLLYGKATIKTPTRAKGLFEFYR